MKINDREVFAVAPVRCCKKGRMIGEATGFFYKHLGRLYFITNRHVVIDDEYDPDELHLSLHTSDLTKSGVVILPLYNNSKHKWLEHPIGREIDVVAVPVEEDLSEFYVEPLGTEDIFGDDIPIGQDLLVIGYPLGIRDTKHNTPVIRNAILSSVYPLPFDGKQGVLIDSQLHRGTSGSPVLTKIEFYLRRRNGKWHSSRHPRRWLVGVHSEAFDTPDRDPEQDEPSGLNFVWFASLIPEIIEQKII